ncbi:unnamed protein product [Arabidopsis thaliana]|uniref:Uncharacterized protein n=1 Tax=Arabidopsis thaliana TaxID=3702 RepID=A0A654FKJ3_ARATH|nr:unnamed protein product [Arabidopsis thaliana]
MCRKLHALLSSRYSKTKHWSKVTKPVDFEINFQEDSDELRGVCNQRNADPHCTINQIRKQISSNPKEFSWRSAYQFEAPRLSFLERPTYTLTSNSTKSYHSISVSAARSQDKPSSNLYPRSLVRSSDSLPCSLLARSFGNLSHCSAHQSGHFSARHSDHLGEHPTAPQQLMRSIRLPNSQA